MQGFGDKFILVIPVEDKVVHPPINPFCLDPTCPCKEDQELIQTVGQQVIDGLLTPDEATRFVQGKTL